ncbi:MAG: GNAT family N-acetyltransferase [Ardenticatenaceae bacterium]
MNLPENVTIRPAREEDEATIQAMVREARLDPSQLRWSQFLVALVPDAALRQAQEPGQKSRAQFIGVGQLRRYGAVQELGSLLVLPEWREKGIGAALVRALVARREGLLFLECVTAMAPYYEKFGFRRVKWYNVPWPLKAKFGLSSLIGWFFGGLVAMRYEGE